MFSNVLKRAATQYMDQLPFVLYRKPNTKKVRAFFQNDPGLNYVRDFTESGFVFAPFDTANPTVLLKSDEHLTADYEIVEIGESSHNTSFPLNEDQRLFHLRLVEKGIGAIKEKKFDKVVLSRRVEVDCEEGPFVLFERLLKLYASAFCYLWYHPKVGMWLGATPEILLRMENNRLTTMSLAGTQPFSGNEDPSWGLKERTEQKMVTDYIKEALQPLVSQIKVSEVHSSRAGSLWHLRTKLTGVVTSNLNRLIERLHPTPAVCGLPMAPAKRFVLENENYKREYYTGFLGELNHTEQRYRSKNTRNVENRSYRAVVNTTELFVNLRCMQMKDNKALLYVGGGITEASDAKKEWEETVAKTNTMSRIVAGN